MTPTPNERQLAASADLASLLAAIDGALGVVEPSEGPTLDTIRRQLARLDGALGLLDEAIARAETCP